MTLLIVAANVLGCPVIHLVFAWFFLRLPDRYFASNCWLTRERQLERGGQLYRGRFAVERMKRLLPDGAPWLGGRPKRRLSGRSFTELDIFVIETRRAELAHWSMLFSTPVFYLWNPWWACALMTAYGAAANIPCILAQRANRIKIARILNRLSAMKIDRRPVMSCRERLKDY
jgi:glycosyl-4,4'-diaponeurosporenoate acyltransferase